jgi:hypothetical protein
MRFFDQAADATTAAKIAAAAISYPYLSAETTVAGITSGLMPTDAEIFNELQAREAQVTGTAGGATGLFAEIGDIFRGAVRWTGLAFEGLYDEAINRPLRTLAEWQPGVDLGQAYSRSGNAPFAAFGESMAALSRGQEVNLGTGWFAQSELSEQVTSELSKLLTDSQILLTNDRSAKDRVIADYIDRWGVNVPTYLSANQQQMILLSQTRERIMEAASNPTTALGRSQAHLGAPITARQRYESESTLAEINPQSGIMGGTGLDSAVAGTPNNAKYTQVSLGRILAANIVEPGTEPYHWVSGSIDFTSNIFLDPANLIGVGAMKMAKGARALSLSDEAADVMRGVDEAAQLESDLAKSLDNVYGHADYQTYRNYSSDASRQKARTLAGQGVLDPKTNSAAQVKYQQHGQKALEAQRLEGDLAKLRADQWYVKRNGYAPSTRARYEGLAQAELLPSGTPPKVLQYQKTFRRAAEKDVEIGNVEKSLEAIYQTDEYRKFAGWAPSTQQRSLKLAGQADIDPRVHKMNARMQQVGRHVIAKEGDAMRLTDQIGDAKKAQNVLHQVELKAGIRKGGLRKTVNPHDVNNYITGKGAQRFVEALVDADAKGVDEILKNVNHKVPRELREALANADTPGEVIAALMPHIGGTITDTGIGYGKIASGRKALGKPIVAIHNAVTDMVGAQAAAMGKGLKVNPLFAGSRLRRTFAELSPRTIDLDNLDDAYIGFENWLLNTRVWARGDEALEGHLKAFRELGDGDFVAAYDVFSGAMGETYARMVSAGVSDNVAQAVTRFAKEGAEDALYFIDRSGNAVEGFRVMRILSDGTELAVPGPSLMSELFRGQIHMADPTMVRRAAGSMDRWGKMLNSLVTQGADQLFDERAWYRLTSTAVTSVWKPFVLLRFAWPFKIISEEQLRLAGADLTSLTRHPLSHISMVVADKKMLDVAGDLISKDEAYKAIQSTRGTFTGEVGRWGGNKFTVVERNVHPMSQYRDGVLIELNQLWTDPIVQKMFTTQGNEITRIDDTVQWLLKGEGRPLLDDMIRNAKDEAQAAMRTKEGLKAHLEMVNARAHMKAGGDFRKIYKDGTWVDSRGNRGTLSPEDVRKAPAKYPTYEITEVGNADLIESFGTGVWKDHKVAQPFAKDPAVLKASGELTDIHAVRQSLTSYLNTTEGLRLPSKVKGPAKLDQKALREFDGVVNRLFDVLMARPTNKLSRSPAFTEFYWQRIGQMTGGMDPKTLAKATRMARKTGAEKFFNQGRKAAAPSKVKLVTSLDDADMVAKSYALTRTQDLLFDISKRSNVADSMHIIAPFIDAWKEMIDAWSTVMTKHNAIKPGRRLQQAIISGRESNPGDPRSGWTNEGFFHENDQGREVFTFPGLSHVWEALSGQETQFEFGLESLNPMSGTILPNVGPAVSIPAQYVVPDNPDWDWLNDFIFPFGQPSSPQAAVTPSYLKRIIAAFDPAREFFNDEGLDQVWNGAVIDAMGDLERSDPIRFAEMMKSPEGQQQVLKESQGNARQMLLIEATARFAGPVSPQSKPMVEDTDGKLWALDMLRTEFYEMQNKHRGDRIAAVEEFKSKYGIDPFTVIDRKTVQVFPGAQSEIGGRFARDNPELAESYPSIVYYLGDAWLDDYAEFDYKTYLQQLKDGSRQSLTPEQSMWLQNDTKARFVYDKIISDYEEKHGRALGDPGWDQELLQGIRFELANVREVLKRDFPGYSPEFGTGVPGLPAAVSAEAQIDAFEGLVRSKPGLVLENKALQGVDAYLKVRQDFISRAREYGNVDPFTAGDGNFEHPAYQLRLILRQTAARLIAQYPEFGPIWEGVFSRELIDDFGEMRAEDAYGMLGAIDLVGENK